MDIGDINDTLNQLYREGEQVLADFHILIDPQDSDQETINALLQRLRARNQRFFADLRRQLQDQTQPWIGLLRTWSQLADGNSPADLLLTPMAWWRPMERNPAAATSSPQAARIESMASELADARDTLLQLLQRAADDAIDRFGLGLNSEQSDEQPLRQLYMRWLTAAESAHEDMLASEEFSQATGRFTNAWSDMLLILQECLDDQLASAGLPTRQELSETQAQVHELQQKLRQSERRLQADLAAIRTNLETLLNATSTDPAQPGPDQQDSHES